MKSLLSDHSDTNMSGQTMNSESQRAVENSAVSTSEQKGEMRTMFKLGFKICNALVNSCLFFYFMFTEDDPARAMESLTYQVKCLVIFGKSNQFQLSISILRGSTSSEHKDNPKVNRHSLCFFRKDYIRIKSFGVPPKKR